MKGKALLSSPILYAAAGYLALYLTSFAQEAVMRGSLIPGSFASNGLAIVLMSSAFFGPLVALVMGVRYLIRKERLGESFVAILASIPLLLLWCAAASRSLRGLFAA